jgi:hypothetical protein
MATELLLVSLKSSPGSGAMTSSITLPSDVAYRWYSRVREDALARDVVVTVHGEVRAACSLDFRVRP